MKIHLEFVGMLNIKKYKTGSEIEIKDNINLDEFFTILEIPNEHKKFIIPFINGKKAYIKDIIKDGDKIGLFLPVGGG